MLNIVDMGSFNDCTGNIPPPIYIVNLIFWKYFSDTQVTKFALPRNGFKLASIILIYLMELSREWLHQWSTYNKLDNEMLLVEQAIPCLIVWSLMKRHEIFLFFKSKLFFSPWKFSNFNWYLLVILRRKHHWSKNLSIDVFFGITLRWHPKRVTQLKCM